MESKKNKENKDKIMSILHENLLALINFSKKKKEFDYFED